MKKLLVTLLALCMLFTVCGANAELPVGTVLTPTAEDYPIDLSEPMVINMLLMGDTAEDFDMVLDHINGILSEGFNTTINPTMIGWGDLSTMYPLIITGGEDLDIIFTQNLRYLFNYAADGYYMEYTEDFINTYMPYTAQYQNKAAYDQAKYQGRIYGMPQNESSASGSTYFVSVRDDAVEKYGVTDLPDWQSVMDLWLTIAADEEQTMLALNAGKQDGVAITLQRQNAGYIGTNASNVSYIWKGGELPTADELFFAYTSPDYYDFYVNCQILADAGVWSRSALSKQAINYESFYNGDSVTGSYNGTMYRYCHLLESQTGMSASTYLPIGNGVPVKEAYAQNCFSIFVDTKSPERCAMIIDILKFHTEINHTIIYGIEGYHYINNGDGTTSNTENTAGFTSYNWCPSWGVKNGDMREAAFSDAQAYMYWEYLPSIHVDNPVFAFVLDSEPVNSYMTALSAVVTEYGTTLGLGLVEDLDATYAEFMDKLGEAGLDAYMTEVRTQYQAWYDAL